jgi:transposase
LDHQQNYRIEPMTLITLTTRERKALEHLMTHTDDAATLRRAHALLCLNRGEAAQDIADQFHLSRHTIYKWAARYHHSQGSDFSACLADAPRSGRPCTCCGVIDPLIDQVIDQDPRTFGYRSTIWTAQLLCQYLRDAHATEVSRQSVSLAIKRLRIRWKRPRHHLALRPSFWRQAKGG